MTDVFLKLLNMGITAGWLVFAVVLMRFLLKKAPRWITVALWSVVALRLILPFSLESSLSLVPSVQTVPTDIVIQQSPAIDSGIPIINSVINPILSDSFAPTPGDSVNPLQVLTLVATVVWVAGMVAMLLYALISYLRIRRQVGEAALLRDNVWVCDHVATPFILGCFRPRIYLPSNLSEADAEFVVAHEAAHLSRRDHWWKPLGFLLLTVYWFHPLLWVAYVLLCRDIESACDEKVLRERGNGIKKSYSDALIRCSLPRKRIAACPLTFGEVGVKERVKSVLNYKKPAFWIILVALVACIVLSVCLLTDPPSSSARLILEERGYDIVSQEKYYFTLEIPKEALTAEAYTEEGKVFAPNEITVYQTETSIFYLEKVMQSNESDEFLYLIFNCSYRNLSSSDNVLFPTRKTSNGYTSCFGSVDESIRDCINTYEGSVSMRSWGPEEQFIFYVSKQAVQACVEKIYIDVYCNKIFYRKDGLFSNLFAEESKLKELENLSLTSIFENTVQIMVEYGGAYKVNRSFSSLDVVALGNLEISATRVSDSLSETRDKTHTIVLQTAEDLDPKMSNVPGLHLHFNKDFTEVWADGNLVKPTHSYRISDPQKARALFERLAASSQSSAGGVSGPENVTGTQEPTLREMFPQYFDLPVDKGLQVYVWQMAPSQFYCGLLPGRNLGYTQEEIEALKPANVNQMRQIVTSYNLSKDRISVIPINHSLSSYYYTVDDAYIERVHNLFWWGAFSANGSLLSPVLDEVRCDLDGDGNEETVTLLPGPTSGILTYTIAVSQDSAFVPGEPLECSTVFYPSGGSGWESDFSLEKTEDGRCLLKGLSGKEQKEVYYNITCSDGQITCSKIQD
ncbi:MAG: hypothetical protein IJC19_01240 [Clostridia bacterium]|nr:hypothetical protein [Clostridia bacterium]